jgi:hypothetical protein
LSKPLTILGETYYAPLRYSSGHQCTAEEASALNALFHRDLAEAMRKTVEKVEQDTDLTSLFDTLIKEHSFSRLPTTGFDPIRREAFKLAKPKVEVALQRRGVDTKTLSEKEWEGFLEQALTKQPAFLAEAKRRMDALKEFTRGALSDEEKVNVQSR